MLGLAGMASASQIFPDVPDCSGEGSKHHGVLLVRPLLEFSKEDMYNVSAFYLSVISIYFSLSLKF